MLKKSAGNILRFFNLFYLRADRYAKTVPRVGAVRPAVVNRSNFRDNGQSQSAAVNLLAGRAVKSLSQMF